MKKILTPHNRRDAIALLKMLLPLIGLIGIGLYFHDFVVHAVEANLAINLGIIIAAAYGVVLILIRLVSAMLDFRVIERFGYEAGQGIYMKTLLEQPWLKKRYVRHYLSHIADTGGTLSSELSQNAIENELHALQGEFDSKLELPQFLVGFMIAMGLLGTFIGLLETLTGISGMLDGMGGGDVEGQFMKLVVELRKPLAGMGIAFSASMFGLITSLMLAIMMTNLRRYVSRVIALARNVMHELTETTYKGGADAEGGKHLSPEDIARMALEKSETGGGGSGVSTTLLAGRFDLLAKKIDMLLVAFEGSIAATQKTNDLLSFGPRMREASEKTVEELKNISQKHVEQHTIMQNLVEVNTETVRAVNALLDAQRQSKEIDDNTLQAVRGLAQSGSEQLQASRQSMADLQALLVTQNDQKKLVQALVEGGTATQHVFSDLLAGQKQARAELGVFLQNLTDKLGKGEEINIGTARHLFEVKENFIKLCKSMHIMEIIASGVSGQALLMETLVEEARSSHKTLEAMQQDIHGQVTQR